MTEETITTTESRPWHLWLIGILGTLWNLGGAFDYLATQTENESYMSQFTPEQLEFFYGIPSVVVAFWALAVWGGLVGTILLLLRKRHAAPVLLTSFVCMIVTAIHNYGISNGLEIMGNTGLMFSGLIFVFALGLWLYARAMTQLGVLE
jgi:hypothetical protein